MYVVLACIALTFPAALYAESVRPASSLESEITKALGARIKCKKITVQAIESKETPGGIKTLAVKLENAALGGMTADYVTVIYEKPVIDMNMLKKAKKFRIISSSSNKAGILISAASVEKYIAARLKRFQKKNVRVSVKFTPPYAECFFNVPASEIDPKAMNIVGKYIKGKNVEGYAAVQIKAKDNALFAAPAKIIINHFLVPASVGSQLQNTFGALDRVAVIPPLRYSINNVSIQKNYLFLTN